MSIHWGEERSQGGVAKTGVRGLSGVGMVEIIEGASLCRGGESRLGDTLILPRIRAHREASHNSKLCATNHLKAGRSLNGVETLARGWWATRRQRRACTTAAKARERACRSPVVRRAARKTPEKPESRPSL